MTKIMTGSPLLLNLQVTENDHVSLIFSSNNLTLDNIIKCVSAFNEELIVLKVERMKELAEKQKEEEKKESEEKVPQITENQEEVLKENTEEITEKQVEETQE